MTKSELLEKIRAAFQIFKTDNRAFPKYRGLTEMLDAMVELIDGSPGSEDLSEIRQQIQDLQDQIEHLGPGLSEAEVQRLINDALVAVNDAIAELRSKDASQDVEIKKLKDKISDIPLPPSLEELNAKVASLETGLAANNTRDKQQDQSISLLQQDFDGNAKRDDRQDADIQKLKDDVSNIPLPPSLEELKARVASLEKGLATNDGRDNQQETDIRQLRKDLDANTAHDGQQDSAIQQLRKDISNIPLPPSMEQIKAGIAALEAGLAANEKHDGQQDSAIQKLQKDISNIPLPPSLEEINARIAALESGLADNGQHDGRQDTAIQQLREDLSNISIPPDLPNLGEIKAKIASIETELSANERRDNQQAINIEQLKREIGTSAKRDSRQDEAIQKLREDISNIPLPTSLEEIRSRVATLETGLAGNNTRDDGQEEKIQSLTDWRAEAVEELTGIKQRLDKLESEGSPALDQVKKELLEALQRLEDEVNARLKPLEGLPEKVSNLEQRLDGIKPGIDEATATGIAEAKVRELRETIERRLSAVEKKAAGIDGLAGRLQKAEEDIIKLFGLVNNGGGGGGGGGNGASEAFVLAELKKLEVLLRSEISAIDVKYAQLILIPEEIRKLEKEIDGKTTPDQVGQLIGAAIAQLATQEQLGALEQSITASLEDLKKAIRQAYEAYVQEQLAGFDAKLTAMEEKLRLEWAQELEQAIAQIWKELPGQPFPQGWLDKALEEAGKLDAAVLEQAKSWDDALREELSHANDGLQAAILAEVAKTFALKTELENEKQALLEEIGKQIEAFAATLPHAFTEEEIKALAAAEASRLDELLSERIDSLERLNLEVQVNEIKTSITNIQNLGLEEFKTFVEGLGLTSIVALVNAINAWKEEVQPKVETLEQDVAVIKKELEDSLASGTAVRLSRVCLTGWGVVGGLEVFSDKDYCIHISPGQGVTPDGHLLILPEKKLFIGYYALTDEDKEELNYPFFKEAQVWKLLRLEEKDTIDGSTRRWLTPQTNMERDAPFTADKVVIVLPGPDGPVFYLMKLEDYLEKTGKLKLVRRLMEEGRPFERSDYIFSPPFSPADSTPGDDDLYRAFHPALTLAAIPLYRFGLRPDDDCTPEELDLTEFPETITELKHLYDTWKPIVEEALYKVNAQAGILLRDYHDTLFPQLPKTGFKEVLDYLLTNWKAYKRYVERPRTKEVEGEEKEVPKIEMCYVQYYYDWARDLIRAYHECREGLQELMAELCLLTSDSFSNRNRHLALGPAWRPGQDGLAAPVRDAFRQPPIYNGNAARWEKARFYYRRLFELIESFYIWEELEDGGRGPLPDELLPPKYRREKGDPFAPDFSKIRITPGKNLGHPLGQQAIPFYYPLSAGPGSLHYFWDYQRTKAREYNQHLSYHASDEDNSYNHPEDWHVTRPLYFSLDNADFYRIEGHVGRKDYTFQHYELGDGKKLTMQIVPAVRYLAQKHNLDFEVVEKTIDTGEDEHERKDLADTYLEISGEKITNSFKIDMLGAEHLGGVPRGGTFIIILNKEGVAVADFSLPYRLNHAIP